MKKRVSISLKTQEIIKDVSNIGFMSGEAINNANLIRLKNMLQDITEEGYKERTIQAIRLAVGEIKDKVFDYIENVIEVGSGEETQKFYDDQLAHDGSGKGLNIVMSDTYCEPESFMINLLLSDNCPITNMEFVKNLMHEAVVNRTIGGYAAPIDANLAEVWNQKADRNLEQLDVAMNRRRMIKRNMTTF